MSAWFEQFINLIRPLWQPNADTIAKKKNSAYAGGIDYHFGQYKSSHSLSFSKSLFMCAGKLSNYL